MAGSPGFASSGNPNRLPFGAHAKMRLDPKERIAMDIEDINSIGSLIADLAARTDALRGYL